MRNSVRGILIRDNKLLVIHRIKKEDENIREYYVLPGGGIEDLEEFSDTIIREFREEVGIDISVIDSIPRYIYDGIRGKQYFLLVDYLSGEIGTGNGPEFKNANEDNQFIVENVLFNQLENINLVPTEIKDKLIKDFVDNKKN